MKNFVRWAEWLCCVGLTLGGAAHAVAQAGQTPCPITGSTPCAVPTQTTIKRGTLQPQAPDSPTLNGAEGADATMGDRTERMAAEQMKARNSDRQKRLVADTEKLVALANQLKLDVDKTDKDTMSLDVIRKADEIEKLAHAVKDRMKGT